MRTYKIAVIVGSLRKDSLNKKLAAALEKAKPAELAFHHVEIGKLPLYDQDADGNEVESVKTFRAEIKGADALLFVSPEYCRSIPGVLKNALDQGSRPYGQSVWGGKPGAVVGMSLGPSGTLVGQQHLRNVLTFLDVPTLQQPEFFIQGHDGSFAADGSLVAEPHQKLVSAFLARYTAWVKLHVGG
jgi:chromate reductase